MIVEDTRTGERRELEAKALFVFIGAEPHTTWLDGSVAMDEHGFLLTGRDLRVEQLGGYDGERPLFLETSQPGMFAVGDVHSGSIKRVASAVGEGSMAIKLVHQRLAATDPGGRPGWRADQDRAAARASSSSNSGDSNSQTARSHSARAHSMISGSPVAPIRIDPHRHQPYFDISDHSRARANSRGRDSPWYSVTSCSACSGLSSSSLIASPRS